jgi:hypothetical protein
MIESPTAVTGPATGSGPAATVEPPVELVVVDADDVVGVVGAGSAVLDAGGVAGSPAAPPG